MKFTLAYNKKYIHRPKYLTLKLEDDGTDNYASVANAGIDGDYIVTGEFNGHPVYSNRIK
jgi:hypothetical protein